jgi:hypothetical protein
MTQDMQPMTVVVKSVTSVMIAVASSMLTVTLVMPVLTAGTYALFTWAPCTLLYSYARRIEQSRYSITELLLCVHMYCSL